MRYAVRPMSFGEILSESATLVVERAGLLVAIAAIVYVPLAAVPDLVFGGLDETGLAAGVLVVLGALLFAPVVTGAITFALGEVYLDRPVSITCALRAGIELLPRLVGTWLIASLAIFAGMLLLVVPGVYLMLVWFLVTQVMIFEHVFGTRALARSRELMRGHLWRALGLLLVGALLTTVFAALVDGALAELPVLAPIGAGIAQAVSMAYLSALSVLLYFDVRARRESFDVARLASVIESPVSREAAPSPAG